jgi:uncharacterized membrane protein YvbJ
MAMIKCPECGTEVSDKADKCLKCAYPISGQLSEGKVQTIEKTSKALKKQLVFAALTTIIGLLVMVSTAINEFNGGIFFGVFLTLVGIIWIFAIKTKIWWHHE